MEKKIGFIGYGSMGSMLVEMLLSKSAVTEDCVFLTTRTLSKLEPLKSKWPVVHLCQNAKEVAEQADILFLCLKAMDYRGILQEIGPHMTVDKHLVSIAGVVGLSQLEAILDCQVSKLIPSITSLAAEGISLVTHGSRITDESKAYLDALLSSINPVRYVSEELLPMATELTSCGPGLYASILKELTLEAVKHEAGLSRQEAQEMVARTMLGTMMLVLEKGMDFDEIITRVATRGGITEEGVRVFQAALPHVYDEMFRATLAKRSMNEEKARCLFEG